MYARYAERGHILTIVQVVFIRESAISQSRHLTVGCIVAYAAKGLARLTSAFTGLKNVWQVSARSDPAGNNALCSLLSSPLPNGRGVPLFKL